MGSRRTYAVDSDLCLCRCVNRLITKFWRQGLSSFVLLRLPAAISFGGLGELCSDLQWLRGARGSLIYREPSHFQELKQLGCFFKAPYLWNVFSIPLQHITIDGRYCRPDITTLKQCLITGSSAFNLQPLRALLCVLRAEVLDLAQNFLSFDMQLST